MNTQKAHHLSCTPWLLELAKADRAAPDHMLHVGLQSFHGYVGNRQWGISQEIAPVASRER